MTPQEYDAAEAEAIKSLPPDIVAAFQPVAFKSYAQQWCRRVSSLSELGPWVDCMHEGTDRIWKNLGGLTDFERDATKLIADKAEKLSGVRPRDALLQAVIPFRWVRRFRPRQCAILEFGPGSGYLGALLRGVGHDYRGVEITQPFFLWQQRLWGEHLPWWEPVAYARFDLIVACHMLNEMHERALRMVIDRARCPILVEGWGSVGIRERAVTRALFTTSGWKIVNLETGPEGSSHVIDLLLPLQPERTVTRVEVEALYGAPR